MNARRIIFAAMLASGACAVGHAAEFPVDNAVPDIRLDTIRGGFDFGNNLLASFALERTVLVNGVQAMRTTISIPDIANITSQQASQLQSALQTTVISVGSNSVAQAAPNVPSTPQASAAQVPAVATASIPGSMTPGLIIQNSLDNQAISATTTIDASVNTARMLQNMRVAESVNDAVVQFRGN
ncbi:MAG: hypothetical protein ABWX83_14575 [Luteibacter sp.]